MVNIVKVPSKSSLCSYQAVSNQEQAQDEASKPQRIQEKIKKFFIKYFFEGQKLSTDQAKAIENLREDSPWTERVLVKHRRLVGILIPLVFFQLCWWTLAIRWNYFQYFPDRYLLSITMIFGATIAGMTSEGGGAVAFPVMTLALGIKPAVARDFSLMIQSCGMTAAAFTIFWMKIKLEMRSVFFCSFGATFGMVLGLEMLDDLLSPPIKKLGFVCVWFSFAFSLYLLNRQHKRKTFDAIPDFGIWQTLVLIMTGFIGGIFSAIAGSGVDICSFSILSLLFRVSEKVATPTSVILMAINTCVGFYWRQLMTETGVEPEAWKFFAVCVPFVVFFAPFGSFISSHFHRQVLAFLIYILDTIALVSALIVIPITWQRGVLSGSLIAGGFLVFYCISKGGERLLKIQEEKEKRLLNNLAV
ncbi:uncharacterized protein LOC131891741 isoform X2 [Tigriopus californicus]|uniref:uncharacterized protein LOC131891741 isoform X2 n=1 Tax=Tigriopus californicus TaxID=6832 RepID=UPI0027DA2AE0|nr:uncharacterized protein LOC131891741 isoform X2 [Tigriopus californicus]